MQEIQNAIATFFGARNGAGGKRTYSKYVVFLKIVLILGFIAAIPAANTLSKQLIVLLAFSMQFGMVSLPIGNITPATFEVINLLGFVIILGFFWLSHYTSTQGLIALVDLTDRIGANSRSIAQHALTLKQQQRSQRKRPT